MKYYLSGFVMVTSIYLMGVYDNFWAKSSCLFVGVLAMYAWEHTIKSQYRNRIVVAVLDQHDRDCARCEEQKKMGL